MLRASGEALKYALCCAQVTARLLLLNRRFRGVSIELLTCALDFRKRLEAPFEELLNGVEQRPPKWSEFVLHLGRAHRVHRARHIAVAFQVTQLSREHAVRDVSDESFNFVEPFGTVFEYGKDQKTPLVSDLIEHVAKRTVLRVLIALEGYFEHFRTPLSRMLTCRCVIITEDPRVRAYAMSNARCSAWGRRRSGRASIRMTCDLPVSRCQTFNELPFQRRNHRIPPVVTTWIGVFRVRDVPRESVAWRMLRTVRDRPRCAVSLILVGLRSRERL